MPVHDEPKCLLDAPSYKPKIVIHMLLASGCDALAEHLRSAPFKGKAEQFKREVHIAEQTAIMHRNLARVLTRQLNEKAVG